MQPKGRNSKRIFPHSLCNINIMETGREQNGRSLAKVVSGGLWVMAMNILARVLCRCGNYKKLKSLFPLSVIPPSNLLYK